MRNSKAKLSVFKSIRPNSSGTVAAWIDASRHVRQALADSLSGLEIATALPARKGAKYQHRSHYEGYYWCAGTQSLVWHESMTEYTALMALDFGLQLRAAAAQPMYLIFPDGMRHFPDYFVLDETGIPTLVDVRAESQQARSQAQFDATAKLCSQLGWDYLLLGELEPVARGNLECIAGWRHPRYAPLPNTQADIIAFAGTGRPFGQIAARLADGVPGRAVHHLYKLMWDRQLRFDFSLPLGDSTPVWAL